MLTGACKAGEEDREARGKKKEKVGTGQSVEGEGAVQTESRKCGEVEEGRSTEGGGTLPHYENVFIWPMTDGRCCQPGSGSHCLTVTEA